MKMYMLLWETVILSVRMCFSPIDWIFKDVLLQRKQSLIHEMANQIGISLDINTDMSWYTHEIRKHF